MNFADQPENDATLAKLEFWRREFLDRLMQRGISEEVVEGIDLFDISDVEPMRIRSSIGMIAITPETLGFALSRWLVEHIAEEQSPRFRENTNRLQELLLTLDQPA